jgi:AraC-like DNA-binding protein
MLLAVDDHLCIAAINRHGQAMNGRRLKAGASLWAFFEKDPILFRSQNMGDIAAALVAVKTDEIWLTLITPPESEMLRHYSPGYEILHSRPRLDSLGYFCQSACAPLRVGGLTSRSLRIVREYIDAHLSENIQLETLADVTGLSRYYFARAFKRSVGTPPHCYLVQRRLERAQMLLANTDMPLAHVALESGFYDQSHFSHRFRLTTGVTPKVFRWLKREAAV